MNLKPNKKLNVTFLLLFFVTAASRLSRADDTDINSYFSWTLEVSGLPASYGLLIARLAMSQSSGSRNPGTIAHCCPYSLQESFSRTATYRIQLDPSSNPLPEDTLVWLFSQNRRSGTFTTETRFNLAVNLNGWCSGNALCNGLTFCDAPGADVHNVDMLWPICTLTCCPCIGIPCYLGRVWEHTGSQNSATLANLNSPEDNYFSRRSGLRRLSVRTSGRTEREISIPPATDVVHLTGNDRNTQTWLRNIFRDQHQLTDTRVVFPGFLNNAFRANFFIVPSNVDNQSHIILLTNIDCYEAISDIYIHVSSSQPASNENEYTIRRVVFYGINIELTLNREDSIPQSLSTAPVLVQPGALPSAIPGAFVNGALDNYPEAPPPYSALSPENVYFPSAFRSTDI